MHAVEIAARSVLSRREFSTLVRLPPGESMDVMAERATGLKSATLHDPLLPDFPSAYADFLAFIQAEVQAHGPGAVPLLIGHNIVSESPVPF